MSSPQPEKRQHANERNQIAHFPEIDTTKEGEAKAGIKTQAQKNQRATTQGIAVAAYNVGCFFGAVSTIWIGDRLGRRRTIFVGSSIMVIGATLMAASVNLPMFIVSRVITGYDEASAIPNDLTRC